MLSWRRRQYNRHCRRVSTKFVSYQGMIVIIDIVTWSQWGFNLGDFPDSGRRPHPRKCVALYNHEKVRHRITPKLICSPDVEFCGYSIPHPSEAKMNLRIQTYGENGKTAVDALEKGLDDLMALCEAVEDKFQAAVEEHHSRMDTSWGGGMSAYAGIYLLLRRETMTSEGQWRIPGEFVSRLRILTTCADAHARLRMR